jgi:hypothetical protein
VNELITIRANGAVAEGRFLCRSANAIDVAIVFPYEGFSMSFELVSFDRARGARGLSGEEGMRSARELLRILFKVCRHLDENDEALLAAYEEYRQLHTEIMSHGDTVNDHFLAMVTSELRERLARGEIDRSHYDRELAALRMSHSRLHERLYHLRTEFFRMHFAPVLGEQTINGLESSLGRSLEGQILEYLRRRRIDPERARIRRAKR